MSEAFERAFREALALRPDTPPSRRARLTGLAVRLGGRRAWAATPDTPDGLRRLRRRVELAGRAMRTPPGVRVDREDFGLFSGEWVRAGRPDEKKVILYLHGGAYFFGGPALYRGFSWRLSAATRRPVLMADYRLAPEHTPADALTDALLAYDALLARGHRPQDITVAGDSAGGHLALGLVHALKRRGTPLPAAVVALSPWADLRCTADSHRSNELSDDLLPAAKLAWLGGHFCAGAPDDDPLFDPVRGDYTGFPPLLLISSSTEILRDDARLVAKLAAAAGAEVEHHEWIGQVHVFPVFADFVPEAKAALRRIGEFLTPR
ncbi:alpha/beta hydrolase fold domain-containing protein [Actinocorallia populi]|uniref:alpha/beta hydrolase fold domain-containing protein n=1 Tax=Actinocorallia populi TaxID=2079200 RepID=UPI000D09613D|nr:alpha/beta hydrolase fold domain-containing protein [Actinocorallia populi]